MQALITRPTVTLALAFAWFALTTFAQNTSAATYGYGWYGELQLSYGHEDNIASTYLDDKPDETFTSLSLGGGYATKLQDNAELILYGYFISNHHNEFEGLNHQGFSIGLDYTIQPDTSYSAPWYNLQFSITDLNYKNSRSREAVRMFAQLSSSRRLTTELTGHFGYRFRDTQFNGKSSAERANDRAFNASSHEWFVGADYYFPVGAIGFAELGWRHGDLVTTVSGGLRTGDDYDAETFDPVFDVNCDTDCGYAYRQQGDTGILTLGVSYPFTNTNIDLVASYIDAEGDNGRKYENWLIKLGLVWAF